MSFVPSIGEAAERVSRTCSLSDDVGRLRYVSGARQKALERLGITRVRDLLLHVPHRYLDFTNTVLIVPTIMFSDMIFPIESMPPALQAFSAIVPARWFVSAMRKIMVMGLDLSMVHKELVNLLIIFGVLGTLALLSFKKRLD